MKSIINNTRIGERVQVQGWVKSVRSQKNVGFAEINDGTLLKGLQAIITPEQSKM